MTTPPTDQTVNGFYLPKQLDLSTNQIISVIGQIKKRMRDEKIQELKAQNKIIYHNALEKEFPDFADSYPSLFKTVIADSDLSMLAHMLHMRDKIRKGEIAQDVGEKLLGEKMAQKYVNPVVEDLEKVREKDKNAKRPDMSNL